MKPRKARLLKLSKRRRKAYKVIYRAFRLLGGAKR